MEGMTTAPPTRRTSRASTTPVPADLLTSKQVAARLGISVGTLANWRCAGTGPRAVSGRSTGGIRYHHSDVEARTRTEWGSPSAA